MRIHAPLASLIAISLAAQTGPIYSTKKDRKELRLTLYQSGKAFVQESREITLPKGPGALRVLDLSTGVVPESIQVRPLGGGDPLGIHRQSYLLARPNAQQVMARYEGKTIKIASLQGGKEVVEEAILLSADGEGLVLKFSDRLEVLGASSSKRIILPGLPQELEDQRQVEISFEKGAGSPKSVVLAYLSTEFSWTPTYSAVIQPSESSLDLTAWASIVNFTGTPFPGARIDLLAGDVPMIPDGRGVMNMAPGIVKYDKPPMPPLARLAKIADFEESWMPGATNVGERKLYALPGRFDLLPNQLVQVPFLQAPNVKVRKEYRLTRNLFQDDDEIAEGEGQQIPVEASLVFKNEEAQQLGRQLPAGTVRLYQADGSGVLQFLGEDQVSESSTGMEVRLGLGTVTDLTARSKMTDHTIKEIVTPKRSEEERAFEILFTNRKDSPQTIHAQVEIQGDWTLLSSNLPGTKEQAHTLGFQVQIQAKGQTKLQYRVRTRSAR